MFREGAWRKIQSRRYDDFKFSKRIKHNEVMQTYERKNRINYKKVSRLMDKVKEYKTLKSSGKLDEESEDVDSLQEFYIADTIQTGVTKETRKDYAKSAANPFVKIDEDGNSQAADFM